MELKIEPLLFVGFLTDTAFWADGATTAFFSMLEYSLNYLFRWAPDFEWPILYILEIKRLWTTLCNQQKICNILQLLCYCLWFLPKRHFPNSRHTTVPRSYLKIKVVFKFSSLSYSKSHQVHSPLKIKQNIGNYLQPVHILPHSCHMAYRPEQNIMSLLTPSYLFETNPDRMTGFGFEHPLLPEEPDDPPEVDPEEFEDAGVGVESAPYLPLL